MLVDGQLAYIVLPFSVYLTDDTLNLAISLILNGLFPGNPNVDIVVKNWKPNLSHNFTHRHCPQVCNRQHCVLLPL